MLSKARYATVLVVPALAISAATASPQAQDLSDAEVAHVAVTANAIDIEMARLALERAASADVERFAKTMISDHTSVNESAAALAEKLGVTPAENAVSRQLREQADRVKETLAGLSGAGFDQAYIEREVAYHEAVIAALEGVLIPTTEDAELKELLEGALPAFRAHLELARRTSETLSDM